MCLSIAGVMILTMSPLTLDAQMTNNSDDRISIGIEGGLHYNKVNYSEIDKTIFPKNNGATSGVFGIYGEFELGESRLFSIRPELVFLKRGGKLKDINYITGTGRGNLVYTFNPSYFDIRLPLILNFGNPGGIRPYIYVAPVLGFPTGGKIKAEDDDTKYEVDITKANISTTYFAGMVGAGVKIPVYIASQKYFNITLEASYEYGFSNTYGSKEKDGEAIAPIFFPVYHINGTRKNSGFEFKAGVAFPLSIFRKDKPKPQNTIIYNEPTTPTPIVTEKPVIVKKDCYSLDEIISLMANGEKIEGRTICAIDLINFEFGKSSLDRSSKEYLDKIASLMKRSNVKIEIKGHTDNVGSEEYNMELSRQRAEAVYNYLIKNGISPSKLSFSYYGMSQPITTNDTPEGRKENRRVEFEILK